MKTLVLLLSTFEVFGTSPNAFQKKSSLLTFKAQTVRCQSSSRDIGVCLS